MKHTKKEIETIVRKLMDDIERQYYKEREIYIEFTKNKNLLQFNKTIENCWHIAVDVHDDQSNKEEPASIIIFINDDTLEFEGYLDCSMGRPFPMVPFMNKKGKYELGLRKNNY
jgi:hypothetical protein